MHRLILPILLALAACAATPRTSFRDPALGLAPYAPFAASQLQGDWLQAAGFARGNDPDCAPGGLGFSGAEPETGRLGVAGSLCLEGRVLPVNGAMTVDSGARMVLSGGDPQGLGQPWQVIWASVDARALAVATPSGAFGFVLSRDRWMPARDRQGAAEAFRARGYDTAALRWF